MKPGRTKAHVSFHVISRSTFSLVGNGFFFHDEPSSSRHTHYWWHARSRLIKVEFWWKIFKFVDIHFWMGPFKTPVDIFVSSFSKGNVDCVLGLLFTDEVSRKFAKLF